ncbi:MAG: hypothetical protein TYPL_3860 [Candidatus Tyloplasma litorale]|nr:MAG: hypothetical protein TYPL_3860 [Mycoplasmatales bacterium]
MEEHTKNNSREYYNKIRELEVSKLSSEEIAARFIYLNKAGFNGLYRVNKSGIFNVPWEQRQNLKIYDEDNFSNLKKYLSNSKGSFYSEDYKKILSQAKEGDFIFVDPPYDGDNTFNSYSVNKFEEKDQVELAHILNELTKKKVKWILCNYDTNLIQNLYKDNTKILLSAKRYISSKPDNRKNSFKEAFYFNYDIKNPKKVIEKHEYFSTIFSTNKTLESYVDWEKVKRWTNKHKINLSILNCLLGLNNKKEIFSMVHEIFANNHQSCFNSLEILIAKRDDDKKYLNMKDLQIKEYVLSTPEEIIEFINETKLYELFLKINNLNDYIFGVEVGMDTNARKNRSGKIMEYIIEQILNEKNIKYKMQFDIKKFNIQDVKVKRIDFVFNINNITYLVETSFYNGGGSKISETCNSYVNLSKKLKDKDIELIWVADGAGMKTIKNLIDEQWDNINIMNIHQFKNFLN